MKKSNFVSLLMGTIGGLLFAIGLCMCLLQEWNAFNQGIVVASIGIVVLITMLVIRRRMEGKAAIKLSGKAIGTVVLGIVATLMLGVGMCMTMVWTGLMVPGIIIGVIGILLLICLIPLCKGLK